jgi:predicted transcriptional regulator
MAYPSSGITARAADIGTSRIIQLNESSTVNEAVRTMHQHDVGCVVVMKNTLPSGMATGRDLTIRFMAKDMDEEKSLRDIQSQPLVTCRVDATIGELVAAMPGSLVRCMPIVDADGQLRGIVCLDAVITALAGLLRHAPRALGGEQPFGRVAVRHVSCTRMAQHPLDT